MDEKILKYIKEAVNVLYNLELKNNQIQLDTTKKGIDGDFTLVVFPIAKLSKKNPQDVAREIGTFIKSRNEDIGSYNVINGFLNIKMSSEYWISLLNKLSAADISKQFADDDYSIMIEFSSPNTNKPLHLGHIRNNLLGESISRILAARSYKVVKVNLVNDRGIHICKTILSWMKWGEGKTPEQCGIKGDKFVGDYYVLFDTEYKKQINELIAEGHDKAYAEVNAPLILEAREILRRWESGDTDILNIWKMMNHWVYDGFDKTYKRLGISFDKIYYESDTYLYGKDIVVKGLDSGVFTQHEDSSVWFMSEKEEIEDKLLLRNDGTTVYMTQDIGTAFQRFVDFDPDKILYVVGNEQNYHFQVLKEIVSKFDEFKADKIEHLSYGMVELPDGKMKSREGKVVDADDLLDEMIETAIEISARSGKNQDLNEVEKNKIIEIIALAALKYYILKVDPKKNMVFNPEESIDFNGNTGPFIQYTYARISSVLRKADSMKIKFTGKASDEARIMDKEILIIAALAMYKTVIDNAAKTYNPGVIANYLYELAKEYNQFYQDYSILKEMDTKILQLRIVMSKQVARTIKHGLSLLGIDVPEIM